MEFPKLPSKPPMSVGEAKTCIWRQRVKATVLTRNLMMMMVMSLVRLSTELTGGLGLLFITPDDWQMRVM